MGVINNLSNTIPGAMANGRSLPAYITNDLSFMSTKSFSGDTIPNKIGAQDRSQLTQNGETGQIFPGRAHQFNGTNQYSYFADNGALDIAAATTDFCFYEQIVTNTDITTAQYISGKNIGATINGRYGIFINGGVLYFVINHSGGTTLIADNITLSTNSKYFLFVRVDLVNSKIYFYINGTLQNIGGTSFTGTFDHVSSEFEFCLGVGNNSDGSNFINRYNGQLNDVRIYHKDVTSQLTELMAGECLGDEVAWWPCEDTDINQTFDASGNGYHLTNVNFTEATSFVEGNWQSLYNKYGYAYGIDLGSGAINSATPPDMSSCINGVPTLDLAGDPLVFKGQAKYNAVPRQRSCFEGNNLAYHYFNQITITENDYAEIEMKAEFITDLLSAYHFFLGEIDASKTRFIYRSNSQFYLRDYVGDVVFYSTSSAVFGLTSTSKIKIIFNYGVISLYIDNVNIPIIQNAASFILNFKRTTAGTSGIPGEVKIEYLSIFKNGDYVVNWQFVEGSGSTVYDVSGNGNHLTGVNVTSANWGTIDYPEEDYVAKYGCSKSGSVIIPALLDKSAAADGSALQYPQTGNNFIPGTFFSLPDNIKELYDADKNDRYEPKTSGSIVSGSMYKILKHTSVDFTVYGAADNNYGTIFTATSSGGTLTEDDSLGLKVTQYANNLVTNGGARNENGALIATDWIKTTGLNSISAFADHSSVIGNATKITDGGTYLNQIPLGSELLTNGDFSAWTGDDPDNWSIEGSEDASNYITENSGKCRIVSDGTSIGIKQSVLSGNKFYKVVIVTTDVTSGAIKIRDGFTDKATINSATTTTVYVWTNATATNIYFVNSGTCDVTISSISVKEMLVLGPELITNGTFDTDISSWNNTDGSWSWDSSGKALCTPGTFSRLYQTILTINKAYIFTITVNRIAGSIEFDIGSASSPYRLLINSSGTFTFIGIADNTYAYFKSSNKDFEGTIDNISVREIYTQVQIVSSTNYTGVHKIIPISATEFAIPKIYVAESISAQKWHNGFADGSSSYIASKCIASLTGNSQKIYAYPLVSSYYENAIQWSNILKIGYKYIVKFKYKTNIPSVSSGLQIRLGGYDLKGVQSIVGGEVWTNVILNDSTYLSLGTSLLILPTQLFSNSSYYFEIDELEVREVIDSEFYEDEVDGGDPVVVSVDTLLDDPYRYLTRYINPNGKDLILVKDENSLDYDDHLKLLAYTKNT